MKFELISALLLSLIFSYSVQAATGVKPGLWEHSFTIKSESGKLEKAMVEMKKQMAAMPAEQRKMMEDMLAKQGVSMAANKDTSVKVCISKEQAENLDFPQYQSDDCKNEILKRTASLVEIKFACNGSRKSQGVAEVSVLSPERFNTKADVSVTEESGKVEKMKMDVAGKWLAADCGNIKPKVTKK